MRGKVVWTEKGFAFMENGSLYLSNKAVIIPTDSELEEVKALLVKKGFKRYRVGVADIDNTIETKVMICQFRRQVRCEKCLHGHKELDDCDELKEFERQKK